MIQLTYMIRIVQVAPAQSRLCSATDEAYATTFLLRFLNLLKTGGMLAMKLQKMQALPGLWQKKQKLRAKSVGLSQRVVHCDGVRVGGAADPDDADDSNPTGPTQLAASSDSSWHKHAHAHAHAHTRTPTHRSR